jgi:signal transduction histidine kinase
LNRNLVRELPLVGVPIGALVALGLAVGAGLVVTQLLLAPPAGELARIAGYLTFAGAATVTLGWIALRLVDGSLRLSLHAKTLVSALTGTSIALVNVFVIARLMFVSTAHDLRLLIGVLVFSGTITVFFTMWVIRAVTARTGAIHGAVRRLAAGSYDVSVPVAGHDELSVLARDVNTLGRRLLEAEHERAAIDRERRDLTASVSHDLRTPLASMRAMLEALDDGVVDDPQEVTRYHAVLRREVGRLDRMIDDLFELSRLDAGALKLHLGTVDVGEVVEEVADAMRARARKKGVSIGVDNGGSPVEAMIDGEQVERALANLVQNALEHTPAGGEIWIKVASHDGCLELSVADTGKGISSADMGRIWQRFYRADKSRNRDGTLDGGGLGLAIVKGIVEAHGGSVSAESTPNRGSVFTLRLPRTN